MTTTIGSVDLNALSDLYNDSNQYFWFESNSDATYGAGVHITLSPDTSFVANPSGQNVLINTDGISIRNGLLPMMTLDNDSLDFNVINTTTGTYDNVASFGSTAIVIGEEAKANLHLTFNNFSMVDKDGTKFFEVGDTRNADGVATIKHTETVTVNSAGSATVIVESNISSIVSVYADSVQLSSSKYSFNNRTVTINGFTANSVKYIEITYTTRDSTIYLTVGSRKASGNIGNYSIAEGVDVIAGGWVSHAEGYATTASGSASHAEGYATTASGWASHAEGYATTASGSASHAEGDGTTASGWDSHAGGAATVADGDHMTAIGKYNTKNSGKAFAIGNGTRDTARSDAFTVDWSGNTVMKGGLTLGTALSIANGGTEATTAAAARTNLGLVGVETRTLLWTNASPTSVFAAQTLDSNDGIPDLSGYDAVEIICRYSRTDDTRMRYICDVGGSSSMYWFYYTATDGKYTGVRSRNIVSVSTTGVAIHTCMGKPVNSSTSTTNDGYIIPIEIYGIKGV